MKGFITSLLVVAVFGVQAFAAGTAFQTDTVSIGNGKSSATDKLLKFNNGATTPPTIKLNGTSGRLQFANDGANFIDIGSGAGGSGGGINLLTLNNANPDMELGNTGWTISGGSIATVTSGSNLGNGKTSLSWTPSGSAQTFSSAQFAVIGGAMGKSCMGKFYYKTAESTNPYILNVLDGSSNVLAAYTLPATTVFSDGYATFPCPSSGNLWLQLKTPASAPTNPIYLDDAHLGTNYLASSLSQATMYGSVTWPVAASCTWGSTAVVSPAAFPANSSCTFPSGPNILGQASAPATKIPAITFSSLPPGFYQIVAMGSFGNSSSTNNAAANFDIFDGATSSGFGQTGFTYGGVSAASSAATQNLTGQFNYTTAQSNITFQIRGATAAGVNAQIYAGSFPLTITVYRFPTSADTVFRPDSTPASWSGYTGTSGSWSFATTGSYADPTGSVTPTITQVLNRNFGTVTQYSTLPGITWTPPRTGNYWTCANIFAASGAANSAQALFRLTTDGSTSITEGGRISDASGGGAGAGIVPLCGLYQATSIAAVNLRVQGKTTNASFPATILSPATRGSIEWSIIELDAPMPAPVFQGFIGSNTTGQERVERLQFGGNTGTNACAGSPCTINRQSGAWVSSVTRSSTGTYIINFAAGEFSAAPTCTCSAGRTSSTWCQVYSESSTSVNVQSVASASTLTDDAPSVICMGPR